MEMVALDPFYLKFSTVAKLDRVVNTTSIELGSSGYLQRIFSAPLLEVILLVIQCDI